ncbi:MAG: ATP-binding protein [Chloroflexi bacterium AL-W]|nr:transcriptional regulator [Chloroflexi bacterium AL-N1]NOK67912.1 ATP-binding protein [Chloroflexi bacterium AL-N10]NOK73252.1 ATP-binding protein [Chloroflexi bacterium AL-N5]NOK83166.1 ATP-binding protein [Chloroflexi bacterium AL-W]NOK87583.1 ATP-binding protein [Chloroflexi bacterium AL-N15]
MQLDVKRVRECLQEFDFKKLFIEELGWSNFEIYHQKTFDWGTTSFDQCPVAELAGVVVFEIQTHNGTLPSRKTCASIYNDISRTYHENVLIFVDQQRTQSLWYWVKRDGDRNYPREHYYFKGQTGDLFLSKISAMFVDISELDEHGDIDMINILKRLQRSLDVEQTVRKFFELYEEQRLSLIGSIHGIDDEHDRRLYASVLLNRLMFVYFLQRKRFLDDDFDYLQNRLHKSKGDAPDQYYCSFLKTLFFEGFAKPEEQRARHARALIGNIKYLNGGLFLEHPVEQRWPDINIPDRTFEHILDLFTRFSWNLDDTPGGEDNEMNPDVLGYIFEKYINQKAFGAYYTRPQITEYLCEQTIHKLILKHINTPGGGSVLSRQFESLSELMVNLDTTLCWELIEILPKLKLLDPACGSGAFLVAAMKTLVDIYTGLTGKIPFLGNDSLRAWLSNIQSQHPSLSYYIKKKIITENLFGVDIMEEAAEIARLRLFLALVASARTVDELEALPNIEFNILHGNSLIGLLHVNEQIYDQSNMFHKSYRQIVAEKNRLISSYRNATGYTEDLQSLRDSIQEHREEATATLDDLLLSEFSAFKIKYEQARWDITKNREGKSEKRSVTIDDITVLHPFHWGYEFDEILREHGGFDAIITNPPWETFKPQSKEFFAEHSDLVTKNKMTIKEFERERAKLLVDAEILGAWESYLSRFPYQSAFFRASEQYKNQIAKVNNKRVGTDINLYKLFVEQCYNLLRDGGQCGIVLPGSIYTDLGSKQLREMLFTQTQIDGLFGMENRRHVFEGVDSRFKIVVMTFEKGGQTETFPAAFMRHDVAELERFPQPGALKLSVGLIRHFSPDSLSIMEFHSALDVAIVEKMAQFPLLGEHIANTWNLKLGNEFHMTNDSHLFKTEPGLGRLPLYEGKMIHQFTHQWGMPKYWLDETEARAHLIGKKNLDTGQQLNYQSYRLGHRSVARNTDERTMIATVLSSNVFFGHSINATGELLNAKDLIFLVAMLNSFTVDFALRQRVSANVTMFYIYQLPVPRLTKDDLRFAPIVERAAKLICTTSEFDDLAQAVGIGSHTNGVSDQDERARLRVELDGLIAHLYNLTEEEFSHILNTFPLVDPAIKDAALQVFRVLTPEPDDQMVERLIAGGEVAQVEFKVAAAWNAYRRGRDTSMRDNIVQAVASFMNSYEGGMLLIGVGDDGTVEGLANDYQSANASKPNRDGYTLFLRDILGSSLGRANSAFYDISFHEIQGQDVCRIVVQPASAPVYVGGSDFYIRDTSGKLKLSARDAVEYIKGGRW